MVIRVLYPLLMAKPKTIYTCSACGAQSPQWAGQCGDCGAWNSLTETVAVASAVTGRFSGYSGDAAVPVIALAEVQMDTHIRSSTGLQELDRVLGGGLVAGSVVLLGGDPGIGKSTLLLQVLAAISADLTALYVTGEESPAQIALRAGRIGVAGAAGSGWYRRPRWSASWRWPAGKCPR